MRIGLVSSLVPHIHGGYRNIVDWTAAALNAHGQEVETVYLPFNDSSKSLYGQISAYRAIDFDSHFDRVITFRPPAHFVTHRCKIVWFIHHFRTFYDLWGTEYCHLADTPKNRSLRVQIMASDTAALGEARHLFSNSQVVGDRLASFNGLTSKTLYPPVDRPERFRAGPYGDEILSVCRMEHHKRQHLLVEAMAHTRSPVRLRLCGLPSNPVYAQDLRALAERLGVADRVTVDNRWISEEEKASLLANALANAYVPLDEDSYGYPTIEAAHAAKCTVSTTDAGGTREFIDNGRSGLITPPDPTMLGDAFDRLFKDRALAERLGRAAHRRIDDLGISWHNVVEQLLS